LAPVKLLRMSEVERITEEYARRKRELPTDFYSPALPVNLFHRQTRERAVLSMLSRQRALPLGDKRILDVGCGTGQWLVDFETWGASRGNLAGIDLLPERVAASCARLAPLRNDDGTIVAAGADIREGNAAELPWRDREFDLVFHSMMFSSILDASMRREVALEMIRVLAPGGIILWYDFFVDNPRNPNVRGVGADEVHALFPGFTMRARRITLLPPLARRLVPVSRLAAEVLTALRLLNTHLLIALRRPGDG
jgi:ubiquinone/menaquinone biosynthesis C-methylase UbiE